MRAKTPRTHQVPGLFDFLVMCFRIMITPEKWEYGVCGHDERPARRHKKNGNVQFVLWRGGEQGYEKDHWHDFDRSWWTTFKSGVKT